MKNDFSPAEFRGNFIDGRFAVAGGESLVSVDPGNLDRPVGEVSFSEASVDDAVASARAAAPAWRALTLKQRAGFVRAYGKQLLRRREDIAWTISRETGKPLAESLAEADAMVAKISVTEKQAVPLVSAREFAMEGGARGAVRRKPLGVAAVIGPFNVPGHLPNGQLVPALLTGNTVVFKPSEYTPFTGQLLAECFAAAGFPPGVFNLAHGGGGVGARLAGHEGVDLVFFTGSVATGERVRALCSRQSGKRLALEMGGKNAALVLADAPLEAAARETAHGAFSTTGQRCSSTSRILLHRAVAERFLKLFLEKTAALKVGYFTENPFMGPLIRESAVENFFRAQHEAERLGFRALRAGERVEPGRNGYYVAPSVHLWESPALPSGVERTYVDEELFAPDVAIYLCDSEDEMVAANNSSRYGLVASVFTKSEKKFRALWPRLDDGVIHWNRSTAMTPGLLPFGGTKASGNDWPAGLFAVYACTVPVGSVELKKPK